MEGGVAGPAPDLVGYTTDAPGITAGIPADRRRRAAVLAAALLGVAAFTGARAYSSGPAAPANNLAGSALSSEQPAPEDASTIVIDDADDACVVTTSPANDGYDVVAYFSLKPGAEGVVGSSAHAFVYQGYSYYFATAANRKLFAASPASYVPQWGGFCAYGVSSETWWLWDDVKQSGPKADPNVWLVRSGKLYLFMYEVPKRMFITGNVDARIKSGIAIWTAWVGAGSTNAFANTGCFWADPLCGRKGDECAAAKDTLN